MFFRKMLNQNPIIEIIASAVQPLVFETGISEFPYSLSGTVFLAEFNGKPFVITTRHSLRPESLGPICIFPSDQCSRFLPLKDVFFVSEASADDDFVDIAVIAVDTSKIGNQDFPLMSFIRLSDDLEDWLACKDNSNFFLLGYPEEKNFIQNDESMICNERIILRGNYLGESQNFIHELEISDTFGLSTFSGFSGAPVFTIVANSNEISKVVFCGMAIRGTPTSKKIHFLNRSVLIDALKVKQSLPQNNVG
ncbi:hypothetical protein ACO0LG_07665 [Undibacterium sp. Ji42W]|uniref:hypothetical protein n=1 Tax=Undibacterium sp. Ji42W TaxID=3413039 RepID=UPI003BF2128E